MAVTFMDTDLFHLQLLPHFCNPYANIASVLEKHQTSVEDSILPTRLRLTNQAPEIQVLRFSNVTGCIVKLLSCMKSSANLQISLIMSLYWIHSFLDFCYLLEFLEFTTNFSNLLQNNPCPFRSEESYFGRRYVPI